MEVYVFEKEKTRAFRMERRKHYEHNKKAVEEILRIGTERQVQAGYRGDVHLPEKLHNSLWQDAGKGHELTCVTWLYCEEANSQKDYCFVGVFNTPSVVLAPQELDVNNLEALVAEVKKGLQAYTLYGTTTTPWFHTFEEREALPPFDLTQMQENIEEYVNSLKCDPQQLEQIRQTKGQQAVDELQQYQFPSPPEEHEIVEVMRRGLNPEERQEFIRIYNS